MINLTVVHPDTGDDEVWSVSFKEHTPLLEKRKTATADAGDFIDPDIIYKGSYEVATLTSNPIAASQIDQFNLFRRATREGGPITVGASVVDLVGVDYTAIREGDLTPKSLHGGRYFSFVLNLRVIEVDS